MNDLEQIKEILFGNEKKALDTLVRRLDRPESRTADVADVLPDAVTISYNTDDRLGKALSQPLEYTLSEAIRREPKKFADALFPVMGPAIRKAISEAIKSTLQMINMTIEQKSLANRYKAWRAGVPLAQYVFQKSVIYRVDEVYLVDPESGRLINYLYHPNIEVKDEDAVSAMLTAIQDFVRDSFSKGTGGGLDSVVIDEFTVLISQGPHAMLACVVRGAPPRELKVELNAANERVHLRHSQALVDFDGAAGSIPGLDIELEKLLRVKKTSSAADKPLVGWKTKLLLMLVVGGLAYWIANGFYVQSKMNELASLIRTAPGILTTEIQRSGHRGIQVEGLRDPLAVDPLELAKQAGIKMSDLDSRFQPFQSLEAAMIEKRAVAVLEPPSGVSLSLNDGVLVASGNATATYRDRLVSLGPMLGGVNAVDVSAMRLDDAALLDQLQNVLSPPATVDLSVTQGVAVVSGIAPQSWHNTLANVRNLVPGLADVNSKALQLEERVKLVNLVAKLNNTAVFFTGGAELLPNQEADVSKTAAALREYERLATLLRLKPVVRVVGEVDGSGKYSLNESLMVRRAQTYKAALVSYGVSSALLEIETSAIPSQPVANPDMRRAVLKMSSNN
ncbi:MAG: hypothetical protein AB8G18_11235 [Gammaproteobacteria bacterium]